MSPRLAVSLALVLLLSACGTDEQSNTAPEPTSTSAQPTTTTTRAPSTTEVPVFELPDGTWVATATDDGVHAFAGPADDGNPTWWFPDPTQFGGDRVFLVVDADDEFLKVQLPVQPNGSTGWIRRADVELSEVTTRAEVDLRDNSLTVWDGEEVLVETSAAVGKPTAPTPLGEFFVRDVIEKNPNGAYGSFILGLSGFSETLETFNGGLPAIAIHGTNQPDLIGEEVSNGCVRIPNELVELLAETVPLGTPVSIVG